MGVLNTIGRILTASGLGQEDLLETTKACLDRINRLRSFTSQQERDAMAFALGAMIDELRHRDVAVSETAEAMHQIIRDWQTSAK